eukprot:9281636-Lingulodinium_polyedra.AAC.1
MPQSSHLAPARLLQGLLRWQAEGKWPARAAIRPCSPGPPDSAGLQLPGLSTGRPRGRACPHPHCTPSASGRGA